MHRTISSPTGRTLSSQFFRLALLQVAALIGILVAAGVMGALAGVISVHAIALQDANLQTSDLLAEMWQQDQAITTYAANADSTSLAQYLDGRAATDRTLRTIRGGVVNTTMPGPVAGAEADARAWQSWAEGVREQVRSDGPGVPGAELAGGRALFARFRSSLTAVTSRLEPEVQSAIRAANVMGVSIEVVATAGLLTVVVVVFILLRRMRRLGLEPLRELELAAQNIASGGPTEIPHAERTDEIGALARALRSWHDASREREVLVTQAPVGICRLDAGGRVRSANQRLAQMVRRSLTELQGCLFHALFRSPELAARLRDPAGGTESGQDRLEAEVAPVQSGGSSTWCSITIGAMRGPDGVADGWEVIVEDVTERRRQMERAARVQRELWPRVMPRLAGYTVAGACRPALEVAGDLYDWREWPDGRLDITVADVMGKGMGAALVMTSLWAWLRAATQDLGPAQRLSLAASALPLGANEDGTFVTVFQGRLEPLSGRLSYVDAGHGYGAIRRSGGELVTLSERSLPVGVETDTQFREGRAHLEPGDMLIVHSDGLVERADGDSLELRTFADDLAAAADAEEAVRRLLDRTPPRPADDVTVLVVHRLLADVHAGPAGATPS